MAPVVRAGSPAKPYEVVLKLDAKRPSDARLTLGGRPVEFHLARSACTANAPHGLQVSPWVRSDAGEWVVCMARPPSHATRQRSGRTRARVVSMTRGARRETCGWWSASRGGGSGGRRAAAAAAARRRQMEGGRWRPHLVVWEASGSGAKSARHGPPLKGIAALSEPRGGRWGARGGGRRPTSYSLLCRPLSG